MSKSILTNKWVVAVAMMMILFITATMYMALRGKPDVRMNPERVESNLELSTWVVDWQWESGIDDLRSISNGLVSFQVFAAYFDENDSLYFTEEMNKALPVIFNTVKETGLVDVDLTLVNDRLKQDGTGVQKDPELITRLMATDKSRSNHIDEILDAVTRYDFRGVEIDYEKIKDSDWIHVCAFYTELYQRLQPTYVMMAYNLYGSHSGPGPKADLALITQLASRMDRLPGDNIIAISAGGFDWAEQGKVTAVTEKRAEELALKSVDTPKRDDASGSIYFDYLDDQLVPHTVWYADELTLSQWMETLRRIGYPQIAIWRLGELGERTLQKLSSP